MKKFQVLSNGKPITAFSGQPTFKLKNAEGIEMEYTLLQDESRPYPTLRIYHGLETTLDEIVMSPDQAFRLQQGDATFRYVEQNELATRPHSMRLSQLGNLKTPAQVRKEAEDMDKPPEPGSQDDDGEGGDVSSSNQPPPPPQALIQLPSFMAPQPPQGGRGGRGGAVKRNASADAGMSRGKGKGRGIGGSVLPPQATPSIPGPSGLPATVSTVTVDDDDLRSEGGRSCGRTSAGRSTTGGTGGKSPKRKSGEMLQVPACHEDSVELQLPTRRREYDLDPPAIQRGSNKGRSTGPVHDT